jgi:hypothetical protein
MKRRLMQLFLEIALESATSGGAAVPTRGVAAGLF